MSQLSRRPLASLCILGLGLVLGSSLFGAPARRAGGMIKNGKWRGYVQVDGSQEAIALTMDSLLVKPEDPRKYPWPTLIFKLGLGGFFGSEFESEIFDDLDYDYVSGHLTLSHPANEMMIDAVVYSTPYVEMEGRVYFRSGASYAKLYLAYQTDEPGGSPPFHPPPLAPSLAGQYEGSCGAQKAVFQLETARGLTTDAPPLATGLQHYTIAGALGLESGRCPRATAPGRPRWCVDHAFSSASFDFVRRRLVLTGDLQTETCDRNKDELTCLMHIVPPEPDGRAPVPVTCRFKKTENEIAPLTVFPRRFHVRARPEDRKPLPPTQLPESTALLEAVNGQFYGYLHHESLDRYQPLRLDVVATPASRTPDSSNPHNSNDVFISVSSVLFFGSSLSSPGWEQQYDTRTVYIVPGYTLGSENSDSFLGITQWKQGLITGVWYSKDFGRVGTFEVVKGSSLPPLPGTAKWLPGLSDSYRGAPSPISAASDFRQVSLTIPAQPRSPEQSFLLLEGNARLNTGGVGWPTEHIDRGAYDLYTGAVAWMVTDNSDQTRLVTGRVEKSDGLRLFWPADPSPDVGMLDYGLTSYSRVSP